MGQVEDRLEQAINDKTFPGCVVGVVKANGQRVIISQGNFTYETESQAMKEDSVFDVASITKSIPTSSLILKLIDEEKISVDDKVIKYIPELQNSYRDEVLIKHLLTQTFILDLKSPLTSHKNKTSDDILNVIYTTELKAKPGTQFLYTNAPSILLGIIAERVSGKPLDVLADEIFFKPLGMNHTTFHPETLDKNIIVPTEMDDWRGRLLQGEVHDETAYTLRKKMIAGNAGLFSTVPDLLTFLEMLLNKGVYKGQGYFSEVIIEQIQTNQIANIGEYAGLGWELKQKQFMGSFSGPHTFGKTGFTGCLIVGDIPKGVAMVMLSNVVHPQRPNDRKTIHKLRSEIVNLVLGGMVI